MSMTVQQLIEHKGSRVYCAEKTMTIRNAAELMKNASIGCLLVMDDDDLIGILYEREIVRQVVVPGLDPDATTVDEVMREDFATITPEASVQEAMLIINDLRIRHLPVISDQHVFGIISIGDLNHAMLQSQENDIHDLVNYISGSLDISFEDKSDGSDEGL